MNFNRSIYILWSHAFYSLLRVPKCSAAKIQMLLSLLSSWQCLGALPQQDMQGASLDIETLSTGPGVLWNELDEFVRSLWTSLKRKSLPGYGWKLEYSRDHNIDYYKVHFVVQSFRHKMQGKNMLARQYNNKESRVPTPCLCRLIRVNSQTATITTAPFINLRYLAIGRMDKLSWDRFSEGLKALRTKIQS